MESFNKFTTLKSGWSIVYIVESQDIFYLPLVMSAFCGPQNALITRVRSGPSQFAITTSVRNEFILSKAYALNPDRLINSKKEGKDQESIQSSTTPDPGHHMGKSQIHNKTSHTREPRGQPFPSG